LGELNGYSTTLVDRVREGGDALVFTADSEGRSVGSESAVAHGLRSVMVAPVRLKDRLLGVVYLDSRVAKGIFTDGDADILVAITGHVAVSLETARAAQLDAEVRAAKQQRDLAETMRSAITELSSSLDPDQILHRMLHTVTRAVPAGSAILLQHEGADLTVTAVAGDASESAVGKQFDTGDPFELLPEARSRLAQPLTTPDCPVGLLVLGAEADGADSA